MKKSIRLRIMTWFTAALIVVSLITLITVLTAEHSVQNSTIRDRLINKVEDNVNEIILLTESDNDDYDAKQFINYEGGSLRIDNDFLDSVNGITTALYTDSCSMLYGENPIDRETYSVRFSDGKVNKVRTKDGVFYIYDRSLKQSGLPSLWLRGVVSEKSADIQLFNVVKISLIALPFLLILAIAGGAMITGSALFPIRHMTEAAQNIRDGGDLGQRINIGKGTDELHLLADTFNSMFERLDTAFAQEQQFTSDASHELRTPMAVIMAQCELTLSKDRDVNEYKSALEVIKRQGNRMTKLIEDMLDFLRIGTSHSAYPKAYIDISALTEEVCSDMALIREKNISLSFNIEKGITLTANSVLFTRLITNLVSNSYRYGKENGHITVSLYNEENNIYLKVTDDGIGISSESLPRIFDRFYREDSSRTSQGTGLGLSIVKEICDSMNGIINVSSTVGEGTEFVIEFPEK